MNTFFFAVTQNILCTFFQVKLKVAACYEALSDDEAGDDEDDPTPQTSKLPSTTTGTGVIIADDEPLPQMYQHYNDIRHNDYTLSTSKPGSALESSEHGGGLNINQQQAQHGSG